MTQNFHSFAQAVHKRLTALSKDELFVVDGVDLYTSYLLSFPEGTNPLFRVNTVHDCSCCRNFIRNMGNLVSLSGGVKQSIWAVEGLPEPYATVASHMDQLVTQLPIKSVFRTKETRFGAEHTYDAQNRRWDHFYGEVAARHRSNTPAEARGALNTTAQVLERGLRELSMDAVTTVLDLINSNSLYRGQEHRRAVEEFAELMRQYRSTNQPELLVWGSIHSPAARFRNTVIGTLVQDLSEGMDLERAVRGFETRTGMATMNVAARALKGLYQRVRLSPKPPAEPEAVYGEARPMVGLFATLSQEQQRKVLAHNGAENHGDAAFALPARQHPAACEACRRQRGGCTSGEPGMDQL